MNRIKYLVFILCVAVHELRAQPDYLVEPLSLNHGYSNEIFAVSHEDGIIYCSDRRTNVLVSRTDTANNPLFHLYYVPAGKDSAKWGIPGLLSKNIPVNSHQGPCTVSASGQEIYFTANDETGQRIYSARKSGNEWINIQPFAHNRPNYTTTHPSLSRDGTRLFFASDIPGGFGGFDIYVCEWTPRGWGAPANIGAEVNTPANELYPFIQGTGELFFSSAAHGSAGGMDIFSVREVNGEWKTPRRMEEPINSAGDDISYTAADADGTGGYLVSNRAGGTFDIFLFKSLFPVFTDCSEQEENDYTYIIREPGITGLDTASIKLMWEMGDGTVKYGDIVEHTYASTGQYDIHLNVMDTLTGELTERVETFLLEVLDIEQPYITVDEPAIAGTGVTFDASKTYLPDTDIEEYCWMFGDGTREKGLRVEHAYTASGVYRVQLGIIGKSKQTGETEKICTYLEITVE